ncbi:DUF6193 family natural product biosynthesis protein [Streptomyces sp. NPDC049040]|uniref:DUF6193 family natural product biosynthesis protein n=1 Tax=Streptomyces sp. NPDC049040 TaxID=3365593 RepID=UPI0037242329
MIDEEALLRAHYPDLVPAGGLVAAMAGLARVTGVPLSSVVPGGQSSGVRSATVRSPTGYFAVYLDTEERDFVVVFWDRGVKMGGGATADLDEVVRAASAWQQGLPLREMKARAGFVYYDELGEAHEAGAAQAVAVKWRMLREGPQEDIGALARAAEPVPEVACLFPYLSHSVLLLSRCTGYPYTHDTPCVRPPVGSFGFQVLAPDGSRMFAETETAEEAVRALAAALPPDCGPARRGTAEDTEQQED